MRARLMVRSLVIGLAGVFLLALIAVGVVYVMIGNELARTFTVTVAASELVVPAGAASIAEGARLSRLRGCNGGCHGDGIEGGVFFTLFDGTRLVAPDLARKAATYSNAELDRVIRHGVRPDGTGVVGMPSDMFQHLNDADLATIITFLRAQPEGRNELPTTRFGPVGRLVLLQLKRRYGPLLAPDRIDHDVKRVQPSTNPLAVGRYLAMSVCTECHGQDLRGIAADGTPDLAIVAAYSVEDFRKLMRTGEPLGGRQLDLMRRVARGRFAYFTDHEVEALYAYLRALAATPANQQTY